MSADTRCAASRRVLVERAVWNEILRTIPNDKNKITIRDFFDVNRDFFLVAIHDKNITNHDVNFFRFSLKK